MPAHLEAWRDAIRAQLAAGVAVREGEQPVRPTFNVPPVVLDLCPEPKE